MSQKDLLSILPLIFLAGGSLLTMILMTFKRKHELTFIATITVVAASFVAVVYITGLPHSIGNLFVIDRFALFFQSIILLATLLVSVFSYISLEKFFKEKRKEEYYLLLMLAALGASSIVISVHFISFFVSLELLSVSLYGLIGYYRTEFKSIEAGLKYLIIAAMASAFLLFGMALIYAVSGDMTFQSVAASIPRLNESSGMMIIAGLGMMVVGIGFKLAVVPFHMWTPDIYEGASSPVTAFIATASKGAMVAVLIRFFILADLWQFTRVMEVFAGISVLSMLIGNILALMQNNVKRILAYSSIAHFGYVLVPLVSGDVIGPQAATFYVTTYIIAILAVFGLITVFSASKEEASEISDYNGLFWKKPFLSIVFTAVLLSLAGIPLTAGFMGKYFILAAGVGNTGWLLVFTLIISSVIGLFYYLRIIAAMIKQDEEKQEASRSLVYSFSGFLVLAFLGVLIVWLGILPSGLMEMVNSLFRM